MNGLRHVTVVNMNVIIADADKHGIVLELVAIALLQTAGHYSAKYDRLPITLRDEYTIVS